MPSYYAEATLAEANEDESAAKADPSSFILALKRSREANANGIFASQWGQTKIFYESCPRYP